MRAEVDIDGVRYRVDLSQGIDLSAPIFFDAERDAQPTNAFGLPTPTSEPFRVSGFVGDTREGGSVNCRTLTLSPHGNGTHTESVGHIVDADVAVPTVTPVGLMPACVLTVPTVSFGSSQESYRGKHKDDDRVVTSSALRMAKRAASVPAAFLRAIAVRIPDVRPSGALGRQHWSRSNPPYLTEDATRQLREWGCEHLLLEVPSIDREDDGGATACHHLFWGVAEGHALEGEAPQRSITEMAVVPEVLVDGTYLLSLQVPPLHTDAAPSRPVLFSAELA
jgi:arylformamidase